MATVADIVREKGHQAYKIRGDARIADAARAFLDKDVNLLVVMEGDRAAGVFTKNDLLRRVLKDPATIGETTVGECATRDFFHTTPDAGLSEVFAEIIRRGKHNVPVLEAGRPVGMVTSLDVALEQKRSARFEAEQLAQYIYGPHWE